MTTLDDVPVPTDLHAELNPYLNEGGDASNGAQRPELCGYSYTRIPTTEDIIPSRSGHTATFIESRNTVVIISGLGNSNQGSRQDVYEYHVATKEFTRMIPEDEPPIPTFGHTAVEVEINGFPAIWVFAGLGRRDKHEVQSNVLLLEPGRERWFNLPVENFITGRWGHSVVKQEDGTIYLFGGMTSDREASNDVYEIRLASEHPHRKPISVNKIEAVGPRPQGRRRHTATIFQDRFMFVFGGRSFYEWYGDLWLYCIDTNVWLPIVSHTSASVLRQLYLTPPGAVPSSGLFKDTKNQMRYHSEVLTKEVECLKKPELRGSMEISGPMYRTGHVAFIQNDVLYISTGFFWAQGSVTYNDIYGYDIMEHRWYRVKNTTRNSIFGPKHNRKDNSEPFIQSMGSMTDLGDGTFLHFGGRAHDDAINDAHILKVWHRQKPLKSLAATWLRDSLDGAWSDPQNTQGKAWIEAHLPEHLKQLVEYDSVILYTPIKEELGANFTRHFIVTPLGSPLPPCGGNPQSHGEDPSESAEEDEEEDD